MNGSKGDTMSKLIIEYLEDESDSGLEWIVWDTEKNLSPSGWLETKEQAEQFIKNQMKGVEA